MTCNNISVLFICLCVLAVFIDYITSTYDNEETMGITTLSTLKDQINKNIGIDVSSIIGSIELLPANDKYSSLLVTSFIQSLTKLFRIVATRKGNVVTPKYLLFTPSNPQEEFNLLLSKESIQNSSFDASLETKFLLHGFLINSIKSSILIDIKDRLLQTKDYNVIVVDWTIYNGFPYTKASANVVFVGFDIANLVKLLMDSKGINPKSVHLIGHSLGAHGVGVAGKVLKNIGRITGLDAASPIFKELPTSLRLTISDAEFVDAIHTSGASNLFEGFGIIFPYADIDFFPNGGIDQPHCKQEGTLLDIIGHPLSLLKDLPIISNVCNHESSMLFFLNSIAECEFESVHCSSYSDFEAGKCPQEDSPVSKMGFYATPALGLNVHPSFFLDTTSEPPYCHQSS